MRKKLYIFFAVFALTLPAASTPPQDRAEIDPKLECRVKAALLYNFIRFTEWPEEKIKDSNAIIIGLLGDDDFSDAFDPVKDKPIKGGRLVIKAFGKFADLRKASEKKGKIPPEKIEALRQCHVLFICGSEKKHVREIIELVKDHGVLTIGETDGFLETGGIVCLVKKADKIAFEVNLVAAKHERLRISSRVLRLAKRVIQEKSKK